jgi:hypothetical protein
VLHNWGNSIIESLENFYGLAVEDLAIKLAADLSTARARGLDLLVTVDFLRSGDFLELYLEQQHSRPIERVGGSDLPDGHLRAALVGRELVKMSQGDRRVVYIDGKHMGHDRLPTTLSISRAEIKASLCYAHDVVLEDPFDEEQDLLGLLRPPAGINLSEAKIAPDPTIFVANIAALADLATLVRAGVVRFCPRRLAMNPRNQGAGVSNAWDLDPSPDAGENELVDRMMRVWLHSGGTIVPLFTGETQERKFSETLGVLAEAVDIAEVARLRRLGRLALPSADGLDLHRMIDIRDNSAFRTFRTRQRTVLAAIAETADDFAAGVLFREEMRAAADEVVAKTRRQGFAKALSPKLIGWGVGSIVGASFDWRVAAAVLAAAATGKIADFLSSSTVQALADVTPRSTNALHHHYATLASPVD